MEQAPIPENENERLKALHELNILDTPPEAKFDVMTKLAAKFFDVPIASISLIDANRVWYKSNYGACKKEVERSMSLCAHTVNVKEALIISDARQDPRFSDNPSVVGEPFLRFYAGIPLFVAGGLTIGTFCLKGMEPKTLSPEEIEVFKELAKWAELVLNKKDTLDQMDPNTAVEKVGELQAKFFATVLESSPDSIMSISLDGIIRSSNRASFTIYGYSGEEIIGQSWKVLITEDATKLDDILTKTISGTAINEYKTTSKNKNGSMFHISLSTSPIYDENNQIQGIAVISRDITKKQEVEQQVKEYTQELERFNKIMVDREMKMIELKKEIERLTPRP